MNLKKNVILIFLFVFLCSLSHAENNYSFCKISPSGHLLYYKITTTQHTGDTSYFVSRAHVTYPTKPDDHGASYWSGRSKPIGDLVIPDSVTFNNTTYPVTNIDFYAFYDCTGLTSVSIPATVSFIGTYAFSGCSNISSFYFFPMAPPDLGFGHMSYNFSDYFPYYSSAVFHVPCGTTSSYQTSWSTNYAGFTEDWTPYNIVGFSGDSTRGNVITAESICGPSATFTAIANHGYHFSQWNDGNTDNPRTITLIQDTAFTAYFDRSSYNISVLSNNTAQGTTSGNTSGLYLDSVTFSAIANYGYHFSHWNDGNTNNPRIVQVSDDATYTAYFDYDQFTITVQSDNTTLGNVSGGGSYSYLSNRTITATANYGYHFSHWSDGDTNNPRAITLTQDTSFTAYFERNSYEVTVLSNNNTMGQAFGSDTVLYLDSITISATSNYGYHFAHWQDNHTDNPRVVQVTQNKTYTAYFDYNQYTISLDVDTAIHGNVSGSGNYNYL